jgi:hypothetical protein
VQIAKGKEKRYRRVGECIRCGRCCANEDCEHFTPATETEPAICAIWGDPERELKCTEWPPNPPIVIEGCGYKFVDRVDEERGELGYREL